MPNIKLPVLNFHEWWFRYNEDRNKHACTPLEMGGDTWMAAFSAWQYVEVMTNQMDPYVLVQLSGTVKFWSGSDFVEDLQQAIKFPNYGEAGMVLWHEIAEKFVKTRIVPIPLSALESVT